MSNIVIDKEKLNLFSSNAPLIYVGYQKNPNSVEMDGWLREGEELPDDVFKVEVRQRFPIITSSGLINNVTNSYNIYVGRRVSVYSLLENGDLLKDKVADCALAAAKKCVSHVVVADVDDIYNDDIYIYPLVDGDFQVDNVTDLKEVVSTIVGLHGELIQKPVDDGIKMFRKTL